MAKKILTVLVLSLFITSGSAFAADIDLGEGYHVPASFDKILITSSDGTAIQNAVEHIQSGGTITLSGDFKLAKTINIKKDLTLKGADGERKASLDRGEKDRVIRCQGNITLENLTITGGSSTNGGGVKLDGGTVTIKSCDIHGNTGIFGGGGIHSQADRLELTSCDISNNVSMVAGGGISALGGTITMTSCDITSNEATYSYGGGIGASGSNITMTKCIITNNSAPKSQGGGIAIISSASLTSTDCIFSPNTASADFNVYSDSTSIAK